MISAPYLTMETALELKAETLFLHITLALVYFSLFWCVLSLFDLSFLLALHHRLHITTLHLLDFQISKPLVNCCQFWVPLLHCCVNKRSNINCQTPPFTSLSNYVGQYSRLYDGQSVQLPMMLTASNNFWLSFRQLAVDLLCLEFLSYIPFVSMVMNLFFEVLVQFFS